MRSKILAILLILLIPNLRLLSQSYKPPVFSDPERMKKIEAVLPIIDRLYKQHAERNHFPGLAYALIVDGKLVYSGVSGFTDVDKKIPVTTSSMFRIASMSKSVTALAILKLRDEGKLDLDDPVYKYIPEMKNSKLLTSDAPAVTIRHLLTHAAGFPEDNPWGDRQMADTDKELVDLVKKGVSFSNSPGITYEYSNLGFALLGYIVKQVSGMPFDVYTREKIFKPLGMNNSAWEYSKVPAQLLAHGYRWQNGTWSEESLLHHGSWGSMGGMITSIDDFSKYIGLHLSAWPPRNDAESAVLRRSSLREMHHPSNISGFNPGFRYPSGRTCATASAYAYGLGWVIDCEGREYIAHSGGLPGFGSQWRMMPEYGIAVVAFANVTYAPFSTVNYQVLDTLIKLAELKPRKLPVSAILEQRKNEIMQVIPDWTNKERMKIFAENFFPDYVLDLLKKNYKELFSKTGRIVKVHELEPFNQLRGRFRLEGEKADLEIFFTLNQENPPLIQQMDIREVPKK